MLWELHPRSLPSRTHACFCQSLREVRSRRTTRAHVLPDRLTDRLLAVMFLKELGEALTERDRLARRGEWSNRRLGLGPVFGER